MNIHNQLKNIRILSGLTQKGLGQISGATQNQVSRIEGGKDCYISTMRSMLQKMGYDLIAVPIDKEEGGK